MSCKDAAKAHVEWIAGIIRAGPFLDKYGDPYEFACTIVREGDSAVLKGAAGKYSRAVHEAIKKELLAAGIKDVTWERLNNKPREVKKEIGG